MSKPTATKRYMVVAIAAAGAVFFSGVTVAIADKKKTATVGVQKDKMQSATKNAEAVKSLLRKQPKSSTGQKPRGGSHSRL
jgi:hypothetical protein